MNLAIVDERGEVVNVVVIDDPDDTDLIDAIVREHRALQAVVDQTASRGMHLDDGVFIDRLALAETALADTKARVELVEAKLTKGQLAEIDGGVAVAVDAIDVAEIQVKPK
jgi:hypothetical protein